VVQPDRWGKTHANLELQEGPLISRVIDIHPHIISSDDARYPRAPVGGEESDWARDRPVSFERFLDAMDEAGVDKAAIVQASTCYGYDNSYLADSIAMRPGRVTGVGTFDIVTPGAPERIRHWAARGITGMRLYTGGSKMAFDASWLDDPRTFPAWEAAAELGLPICVQTRPYALPKVEDLAARFPGVKIVIDHLARAEIGDGPPYLEADPLFRLARFSNVFLKMTPRTLDLATKGKATPETFFPKLVSIFGADRIAFGSNYPSSVGTLAEIIARAKAGLTSLSEAERHMILAGTAQILYPTLKDA
jgi:L-fuconolactonase